ncbi:hypothetical protein GOZ81_18965 [Agrobacterium vitis]|uniref:hypothetical protein n=1 Tax=Agrobacterium vitis TaxID=373 RepID=UPI0012E70953|nr:hypothetical protein [Agrobacterium vitis]MVA73151.1 hypothetical protein [Agrobacterium vitis]
MDETFFSSLWQFTDLADLKRHQIILYSLRSSDFVKVSQRKKMTVSSRPHVLPMFHTAHTSMDSKKQNAARMERTAPY